MATTPIEHIQRSLTAQPFSERIRRVAELYAEGNLSRLADRLDVTPQAISRIITSGGSPNASTLELLVRRFPTLNPDWLLTGEGPEQRPAGAASAAGAVNLVLAEMEAKVRELRARYGSTSEGEDPVVRPSDAEVAEKSTPQRRPEQGESAAGS